MISKGVFTSDASVVGKVIAVRTVPKNAPALLVQVSGTSAIVIDWSSVAGGKDIIVLKPGFDRSKSKKVTLPLTDETRKGWDVGSIPTTKTPQPGGEPRACPTCGTQAAWIGEYGRWYCNKERKYL